VPHPFAFFAKGWETTTASIMGLPAHYTTVTKTSLHEPVVPTLPKTGKDGAPAFAERSALWGTSTAPKLRKEISVTAIGG
jgi:hypothetical protein